MEAYPESKKKLQNINNLKTIYDFGSLFLVECPDCSQCANIFVKSLDEEREFRLVCENCGHSKLAVESKYTSYQFCSNKKQYKDKQIGIGSSVDWYFHLPLLISIKCKGHTLWAYNMDHLHFIEEYVKSKFRGRKKTKQAGVMQL